MDEKQIVAMIATILEFMNAKETTPLNIASRYRENLKSVIEEHKSAKERAKIDRLVRKRP